MSKIKINNQIVDYLWLSDTENVAAQHLLERNYHNLERPSCLCLHDNRCRELVIKKRTYFFLARMPGTSGNHVEWCELNFINSLTLSHDGKLPAIIEKSDTLDVKLNCILNISRPDRLKTNNVQATTGTGNGRSAVTLLGLLTLCMKNSKMNIWFPHRNYDRSFNTVQKNIVTLADNITTENRQLFELLFMPRWEKNRDYSQIQNQQKLHKKTARSGNAVIIIGIVKRWIRSKWEDGGVGVSLDLLDKLLWIPVETATTTEHSFGQLILEIGKSDRYIIAICTVFRSGNKYTIGEIAFMRTNKQFIPVDSNYERQVADKLIAENRAFSKPLRLENERYLPDFILTDCNANWMLEVFGMTNNTEYLARKEEKLSYYQKNNILCWQWTPQNEKLIPEFPRNTH
jgi:hypothetical protein